MTVKAPDTRDGRRQAERALASFVIDCEETRDVGGRYTVEQWWDYATTVRAGTIAGPLVSLATFIIPLRSWTALPLAGARYSKHFPLTVF